MCVGDPADISSPTDDIGDFQGDDGTAGAAFSFTLVNKNITGFSNRGEALRWARLSPWAGGAGEG